MLSMTSLPCWSGPLSTVHWYKSMAEGRVELPFDISTMKVAALLILMGSFLLKKPDLGFPVFVILPIG